LFRDPMRHRGSCNTAGLSMTDGFIMTASQFETDFRDLGGFTRSCLATDNNHLMFLYRFGNIITSCTDRKILWICNFEWKGMLCGSLLCQAAHEIHSIIFHKIIAL